MDLEKYRELADLNENIFNLKLKKVRFEEQQKVFSQIHTIGEELNRLNFVNDFIELISQNLKKMSALTLALMNQSEDTSSLNCLFELKKELKSVLMEYLQRIINFTLNYEKETTKNEKDMQLDQKFNSNVNIAAVYDFLIKKIETDLVKDANEKNLIPTLNEIAQDFRKIHDQLEKFDKVFN